MSDLQNAHVQRAYRPVAISFVIVATLLVVAVIYTTWTSSQITITPKLLDVSTPMTLTFGDGSNDSIAATITTAEQKATVTATPSGTGTPVPAHASGDMTIINTTGKAQPLAAGTRLQSTDGVIVRTTARVDVPAQGRVTTKVIADPLGDSGNVPAGRFTIVALWPGLQQSIYGETDEALSGGTTLSGSSLSLDELTKASDAAEQQIQTIVGSSRPGFLVVLDPISVSSSPKIDVPSASYAVTVTVRATTITYDPSHVRDAERAELQKTLDPNNELTTVNDPKIAFDTTIDPKQPAAEITATGQAQLRANSPVFSASSYTKTSTTSIRQELAANPGVKTSTVRLSPWWRTMMPDQATRITVTRLPAQP